MRLFIAIVPPPEIRESLCHAQLGTGAIDSQRIRWTAAENLHMTVKFLGEVLRSLGLQGRRWENVRRKKVSRCGRICWCTASRTRWRWLSFMIRCWLFAKHESESTIMCLIARCNPEALKTHEQHE